MILLSFCIIPTTPIDSKVLSETQISGFCCEHVERLFFFSSVFITSSCSALLLIFHYIEVVFVWVDNFVFLVIIDIVWVVISSMVIQYLILRFAAIVFNLWISYLICIAKVMGLLSRNPYFSIGCILFTSFSSSYFSIFSCKLDWKLLYLTFSVNVSVCCGRFFLWLDWRRGILFFFFFFSW